MASATLSVGRSPNAYCVRLHGRCTMAQSPVLHEFVTRAMKEGQCTVYLDVAECNYVDSTFLGSLLDLHKQFGQPPASRLALVGPQDVRERLFGSMHLDRVLRFEETYPEGVGAWTDLCSDKPPPKAELARHVMECHRRLAEVDGPNREQFATIADKMERELTAQKSKPGN